jgi:D-alanyl-D-alanine carboxypeptidase
MRTIVAILLLSSLLSSCKPEKIIFPTKTCFWRNNFADHPKNDLYQSLLNVYVNKGFPGINLLVAEGKDDIWIGSSGVSRIETQEELLPCHPMPVGGVSQLFAGVAAMLMYEDGILDLDLTVQDYLGIEWSKPIPNASKAAVGHLLSHTSGLPDYTDQAGFKYDLLNNKDMDMSRENILEKYVYRRRILFEPGKEYDYSNSNYEVLTLIQDEVYPNGHADYFSFRLLTRLGLEKTYYKNETDYFSLSNYAMANGYFDRNSSGKLENSTDLSLLIAAGQTGSAGFVSTVGDLFKLMAGVFETELIRPATLDKMKTYILKKEGITEYKYGLGIMFKDFGEHGAAIGQEGRLPGFTTQAWYFPDHYTYIIYQVNIGNMWSETPEHPVDLDFMPELLQTVFQ